MSQLSLSIIEKDALVITLPGAEPNTMRNWLIESLASCIRWKAQVRDVHRADDQSLQVLSELLSALGNCKEQA